jgi:hypothetical protein
MSRLILGILMLYGCAFAQERDCRPVGGGIVTNFVDQANTLGSATGDLAGGLGVTVTGALQSGPNGTLLLPVHHHWVTTTGETLPVENAVATLYPTSSPGLFAVSYVDGVQLGSKATGTGRYAGATGKIHAFGALVMNSSEVTKSQITLRYSGEVCLARWAEHEQQ